MQNPKSFLFQNAKPNILRHEASTAAAVCKFHNIPFTDFAEGRMKIPTYFFLREQMMEATEARK